MTYHLIAFATNCVSPERAEVEWTLATCGLDGNWYDWNGQRFYPFHTQPIDLADLPIPPAWTDHIQALARQSISHEPAFDLAAAMGLHQATKPAKPAQPFPRRI